MRGPSDDFILNGEWHRCCCGARWSDSDLGPCHEPCEECGEPTEDWDVDGRCIKCADRHEIMVAFDDVDTLNPAEVVYA